MNKIGQKMVWLALILYCSYATLSYRPPYIAFLVNMYIEPPGKLEYCK